MSQQEKSGYYQALKRAGAVFDNHYREYSEEQLKAAFDKLPPEFRSLEAPAPAGPTIQFPEPPTAAAVPTAPVRPRDPNEMPGQRQNSKSPDEPIRTDEQGRVWFQEEVQKPAFAKPRGRRILKYNDPGTRREDVTSGEKGEYSESFEVAGDRRVPSEVRITLPSYQVGIYKDPRFPFRIHTYNGVTGFNLFDVQEFYGGAELVPDEAKRRYVENVLCYDIRTTVRAIESEDRRIQLAGKVY